MSESFLNEIPISIREKIDKISSVLPDTIAVFEELYNYAKNDIPDERRKIVKKDSKISSTAINESAIIFKLNNISVLSPLRKKLSLFFHLSESTRQPCLSLLKDSEVELSISNLKKNVVMATFLPVPEKKNLMYLFIKYNESNNRKHADPILISLNKETTVQQFQHLALIDNSTGNFEDCVEYMRKQAILTGFRISDPFSNASNEQNRTFHVECHRGTKEGTLYFLPDNIIFGFKKPILVFDSSDIGSITYSSITRLTFNVTLITKSEEKYEFSMIDQTEYANIDEYVKRKQVTDKSMSEELKAKSKSKNQNEDQQSILQETAEQMQKDVNINNVPLDSDDEEDGNFEADSELSDGSEDDEDEEEEVYDNASENKDDDEINKKDTEDEVRLDDSHEPSIDVEESETIQQPQRSDATYNLGINGLSDIPIEIDDEEEDSEDSDEGSGVEYD